VDLYEKNKEICKFRQSVVVCVDVSLNCRTNVADFCSIISTARFLQSKVGHVSCRPIFCVRQKEIGDKDDAVTEQRVIRKVSNSTVVDRVPIVATFSSVHWQPLLSVVVYVNAFCGREALLSPNRSGLCSFSAC